MESELPETMADEEGGSSLDLSSTGMKTEPEDGDLKDIDIIEHAIKRDSDDGEALEEPLSVPTKAEPDLERVKEETEMGENFEAAEHLEGMDNNGDTLKRESDDEEALMEPVFVPVNVDFEGTTEETIKKEISEENGNTEESTGLLSIWPHVECSFQIASSSSGSPSTEAVVLPDIEMQSSASLMSSSENGERECRRKAFECSSCKTKFHSKYLLNKHMCTYTGENSYTCSLCEKSFFKRRNLTVHMRVHKADKPYKCRQCEKSFKRKASLTNHMRIHTGEKPYKCSQCEKSFSWSSAFSLHMRVHTGEKPYQCNQCEKSFSFRSAFVLHMRVHTGEKPYKCTQCHISLTTKGNLMRHMRFHTGGKPHKCSKCEKSFRKKSTLNKHMFFHSDAKPYKCTQCDESFRSAYHLAVHMPFHPSGRPYKCSQCEKSFLRSGDLKGHMRIIHSVAGPLK